MPKTRSRTLRTGEHAFPPAVRAMSRNHGLREDRRFTAPRRETARNAPAARRTRAPVASLAALLLAVLSHAVTADFNDGVVALMTGDHEKALATFVPLAETSDHAFAQYFLGRMYESGQGVANDPETAAGWYRKAAEKGVADAQYRLGSLYEKGEGVPGDLEYAYGWYSVAGHLGNVKGQDAATETATKLSATELVEAKKLARDLIDKYGYVPKSTARTQ